ncbi:MAG TPA: hypothetical protein VMY42_12825, partial [Thermoguttaceae bacterium]|nr:hypothetical protein [Thermoguttaceae bacterium]
LYRGLGAVVVGGLVCSTLFTLIVVPLLFSLVLDVKALVVHAFSRGSRTSGGVDSSHGGGDPSQSGRSGCLETCWEIREDQET